MTPSNEGFDQINQAWAAQESRMTFWKLVGFTPTNVLDVGACLGEWSKCVHNVWPDAKIVQVEADERCRKVLEPQGYELHMVPLSQRREEKIFYVAKADDLEHVGNSSLYLENLQQFKSEGYLEKKVITETIDNIFSGRSFDYIKLDTQGSELDILRGGVETMKAAKFVQLEVSFFEYNVGCPRFVEVIEAMSDEFDMEPIDVFQLHYLFALEEKFKHRPPACPQIDLLFAKKGFVRQ